MKYLLEKILGEPWEKSRKNLSNIETDKEEIMSNAHNIILDHLNSKNIYGYEDQKTLLFGK